MELSSPFFAYRLTTRNGLRALTWENKLTRKEVSLGDNPELAVDIGLPSGAVTTVQWLPPVRRSKGDAPGEATFELAAEEPKLSATVRYTWDADQPVLRKFAEIRNDGDRELNRLLNVRLGEYQPAEGTSLIAAERGFPAYIADEFFLSLAHPAGFADVKDGKVVLRQYPGIRLAPGQKFRCMESVYGVAPSGRCRDSFVGYVRTRMRRVLRGHDKPYAILEAFGGQPNGDFWVAEWFLLEHLQRVAQGLGEGAPAFDFYCTEFWHDSASDLKTFHPRCFPNGYSKVRDEILRLGMKPCLWIDSGGVPKWTMGDHPAVQDCYTQGRGKGQLCQASEPLNTMYKEAFLYHLRENKVGLLKFDMMGADCKPPCCDNPAHAHLPGPLYSVEAIHNALIDFFRELDAAYQDVLIMLYWGYRSPWWLEYGDTYFESGAQIEARDPAEFPAPYARASVTQRLDQAQWLIVDTPWLGKDSLGVWLSDWPAWNSGIGKSRWQEGFIMDLCRGSLLAQIWTDSDWLTPPERRRLGDFVALLRANPACFRNSRFILGNPWKNEPYGYACSDGRRAFLAVHNACLEDRLVTLPLGKDSGLPGTGPWEIYRWYPQPARLRGSEGPFADTASMAMRPFEVVLLEVVPHGEPPSLDRTFGEAPVPKAFTEPSRRLELKVELTDRQQVDETQWRVLRPSSVSAVKAQLTIMNDNSVLASGENANGDVYTIVASTDLQSITGVLLEAMTHDSLPCHGPGRGEDGCFSLCDFRLFARSASDSEEAKAVTFKAARADFHETLYDERPVQAAIDADPDSRWSIRPQVGIPHAAVFELDKPLSVGNAGFLVFRLMQGDGKAHRSLGRVKLSVCTQPSPTLPAAYLPGRFQAHTQVPVTSSDCVLLITGDAATDVPHVVLGGRTLPVGSVWPDTAMIRPPWKAWRAEIGPDENIRRLEITAEASQCASARRCATYLLPE